MALDYFEVECPEPVGGEYYRRIASDVLQDQNLLRVVDRLHIFIDPGIPLFVAVGTMRKLPPFVTVADFAEVAVREDRAVITLGNEAYLAPLLSVLWERFGRQNVDQPDRFTVVVHGANPELHAIDGMHVSNPSEGVYKDLIYAFLHIAPEGFKVRRQQFVDGKFYFAASEDTLPEDVVDGIVRERFRRMGVTL
ncbi:MAG: methanogenesis marker 17 protein [Methanomicrobiales archaeon]|nr:methanogenesis marker 17 protein [Methanomicrobiales archaeon]MDI6876875.1 methanogenesis marker 17 protein [Methanomicrobiales archaeon]